MNEIYFESIESTHAYAKNHSSQFDPNVVTCLYAGKQTKGYGKWNRPWISPEGNLALTLHFILPASSVHLTSLAQVMTTSLAKLFQKEALDPKIKWPNDLLLNGKKIAGVLCELLFQGSQVTVLLSVGLNLNMERSDLANVTQPATSLKLETGYAWDREKFLRLLQTQFSADLELFRRDGFTPFHSFFEGLLHTKTDPIRFFDGRQEWVGSYHSLNEEGGLTLRLPDGTIRTIYTSGD